MAQDRERWTRLSALLEKVRLQGIRALTSDELVEIGRLYRRAASELSHARTTGVEPKVVQYLTDLVGRAYGYIYVPERKGLRGVAHFFVHGLPTSFRRNVVFTAVAFAIFILGAVIGMVFVERNREAAELILGPGVLETIERALVERHREPKDWLLPEIRPAASSFIVVNNVRVAFTAFALGIFGCLGTIFILAINGLFIGIVSAAIDRAGVELSFWSFVLPHGVLELPAIFIASGAGLMLGYSLINPGNRTRRDALKLAGREAIKLIIGVVALLAVAAVIEAFFSPTLIPQKFKLMFAGIVGVCLVLYLARVGGDAAQETASAISSPPP